MPHWTDYLKSEKPKEKHWTDFMGIEFPLPELKKPKVFDLMPQVTTEALKLLKRPEPKPKILDVTKPYYPEPVSTFVPRTVPKPAELIAGKPKIETVQEGIPQLQTGKEPSKTPVDDVIQKLGEGVARMTEGKKGVEWLMAKGSQFVYSIPLSAYNVGDMLGKVVSGEKTPQEGYDMLFQTLPKPVNDFLDVAGGVLSPLASEEQQGEGLKRAWNEWKQNPEATVFSVLIGLAGFKGGIDLVGRA